MINEETKRINGIFCSHKDLMPIVRTSMPHPRRMFLSRNIETDSVNYRKWSISR